MSRLGTLVAAALAAACTLGPATAAAAPYVYSTNSTGNNVSQFDTVAGKLSALSPATVSSGGNPQRVVVSADGKSVYVVANGDVNQYGVSATGTLSPRTPATVTFSDAAKGLALSADGKFAYVSTSSNVVAQFAVSAVNGTLTPLSPATVPAGTGASGIATSPNGPSVYVANATDGTVSQYTIGAGGSLTAKSPATIAAGSLPITLVVRPGGRNVYVTNRNDSTVSQYAAATGGALSALSPAAAITPTTDAFGLAVSPDGNSVYVSHLGAGGLSQYSVGLSGALIPKSPARVTPAVKVDDLVVSPDGRFVYVAGRDDNVINQYGVGAAGKLAPLSPASVSAGSFVNDITTGPSLVPLATISQPADGAVYDVGTAVPTAFTCTSGASGPAITSCVDQSSRATGAALDTTTTGDHALTVTATDGGAATGTRTVHYTVSSQESPPTATAQTVTTAEDTPATFTLAAADADGDPLSTTVATPPDHGTVQCAQTECTYTPARDFNGTDAFGYSTTDGKATASATVTVKVTPVNDAPVAQDLAATIDQDTSLAFILGATDAEGDALSFTAAQPGHGTVTCTGAACTYRPSPGFSGPDVITFFVDDGHGGSDAGQITVTVAPIAAKPGPTPGPGPGPTAEPVTAGQVIGLATAKTCASRRRVKLRLTKPAGTAIASVSVKVGAKPATVFKGGKVKAAIDLRGLPKGRFTVKVILTLSTGQVLKLSRTYQTCTRSKA